MKPNRPVNISLVLSITGLFLFVATIAYFLNKGFELSDESYYLLATKRPFDNALLNSAFGLVNHRLTFGLNDLLSLRLFKLIYQLFFLGVFARSFFLFSIRCLNAFRQPALLFSILLIVVGLSNYDFLPMTLSYNSWSLNFGLLFWSGILFAHSAESKRGIGLSHMLMGLSVLFLFYAKASNAVVMALFYITYVCIYHRNNILNALLLFGLGKVTGIIILFFSYDAFISTTANLMRTIFDTKHTDIGNYWRQVDELVNIKLGHWFFVIQGLVIMAAFLARRKQMSEIVGLLIMIANSLICQRYFQGNSSGIFNEFMIYMVFAFNCLFCFILFKPQLQVKKFIFFSFALILTPFALAAGTSNPIFYTASQHLVFWVAGLLLVLLQLELQQMKYVYVYIAVFNVGFIASFLFHGMILHPYRQSELREKTLKLSPSKYVRGIKENTQRVEKYTEISKKLLSCNTEQLPVLASPPVLGSLILTEMDPFAVCWIADPDGDYIANDEYFSKLDLRTEKPFLFIAHQIICGPQQIKVFRKYGMDLFSDYVVKDSVFLDWEQQYYYLMQPLKHS